MLPRECRVFAAINPAAQWGWSEMFLNKVTYLLELKLWQDTPVKKSERAAHNRKKPKPFVPDFMQRPLDPENEINKGVEQMSVDDVKSWLAVPRGV